MHDLEALQRGDYVGMGLISLKLACPLPSFPMAILDLGATLERLDLSGTGLASLPADFGARLPKLKIAFFSSCNFASFPRQLAACTALEMVAFRGNKMQTVGEDVLPQQLRWLILTDNEITRLPHSIGQCKRLQKCMLAGNRLTALPDEMARCTKLGLLRLSANNMAALPPWLFDLPELAFLSFAGNPCAGDSAPTGSESSVDPFTPKSPASRSGENSLSATAYSSTSSSRTNLSVLSASSRSSATTLSSATTFSTTSTAAGPAPPLPVIAWSSVTLHSVLGSGASGTIYRATWRWRRPGTEDDEDSEGPETNELDVAVKVFKVAAAGVVTSDGTPGAELCAALAAGDHPSLIGALAEIRDDGDATLPAGGKQQRGLVMPLIPPSYAALGLPPSLASCTRDVYPADLTGALDVSTAVAILGDAAAAVAHLHAVAGVAHGDVYAHNLLVDLGGAGERRVLDGTRPGPAAATAVLGDFGAATVLPRHRRHAEYGGDAEAETVGAGMARLEVLAVAHLVEDLLGLCASAGGKGSASGGGSAGVAGGARGDGGEWTKSGQGQAPSGAASEGAKRAREERAVARLRELHARCATSKVRERPGLAEVVDELETLRRLLLDG